MIKKLIKILTGRKNAPCSHKWDLINVHKIEIGSMTGVDYMYFYTIQCRECGKKRMIDKDEAKEMERTFSILSNGAVSK